MTRIEASKGIITQINVFKVDPSKTDQRVEVLKEAAQTVKDKPGWISINPRFGTHAGVEPCNRSARASARARR